MRPALTGQEKTKTSLDFVIGAVFLRPVLVEGKFGLTIVSSKIAHKQIVQLQKRIN